MHDWLHPQLKQRIERIWKKLFFFTSYWQIFEEFKHSKHNWKFSKYTFFLMFLLSWLFTALPSIFLFYKKISHIFSNRMKFFSTFFYLYGKIWIQSFFCKVFFSRNFKSSFRGVSSRKTFPTMEELSKFRKFIVMEILQ